MPVIVQTTPIRDATGELVGVLESQLASVGLLMSSISHGIKGLLTGLDGGVYLMTKGFEKNDSDRLKKGWEMLRRNIDRIRSMVQDILYYTKDRELEISQIEVNDVVGEIREIVEKHGGSI